MNTQIYRQIMTKIFILLLFPFLCQAGNIDCKDIKEGLFRLESEDGRLFTIVRTKNKQTENVGKTGVVSEFDIKWTSDCSYLLFNRRVVKGKDNMPIGFKMDTVYNEIIEVKGDKHKVVSSMRGYEMKIETMLIKLDTTQLYRDLNEIEKFKQYYGSTEVETLISEKYSIVYKQNSIDKTDFLIAFEEVFSVDHKSKIKLHDYLFFKMESIQDLTMSNCRFNDKYDNEIVAVYYSKNDNEEAKIINAWRFNRATLKIETLDISKVKYKVADKKLLLEDK
ncbi:MAG: hypothetical protein V4620_08485 [Bacteroidota bacterium]